MEEKKQVVGGITFTGPITVNGPMFDIHNNQHVHIHNGGQNKEDDTPPSDNDESDEKDSNEELIQRLKPIFYNNEEEAKAFANFIRGLEPMQITRRVKQLVHDRKISDLSKGRNLWTVLHDFGLYTKSESNWNQQVK